MLALGILVAAGVAFGVFVKAMGGRSFDAPEQPVSPRQYW